MKEYRVIAQNIKCDGCVAKIKGALLQQEFINSVDVNKTTGEVLIQGDMVDVTRVHDELKQIGHPPVEKKSFFSKLFSK
jgi:copper chaperone CopZ